jgi:tetratricopeptide (TPR) repeat protein
VILTGVVMAVLLSGVRANAQALKPAIEDALKSGDTAQAVSLLNKEIEVDKAYHLNYYTLGQIYMAQAKFSDAATQFKAALDKKSRHFESMYGLGLAYLRMGQLDSAQKVFEDGRKKARGERHLFENGYGLVMMAKKQYADADKVFRQAIIGDSSNAEYYINLGDANLKQGIAVIAASNYEKAIKFDTASSEVYYHWAEACLELKDYPCAIEKLAVVLKKDSTYAPAWMRAGGIYFKAGLSSKTREDRTSRFRETIGSYKRYFDLSKAKPDSSNVRAFFEIGMAYVNLYGYEDAVAYLDTVLNVIHYEPRDVYFYYGKALWGTKQYERADSALNKHLEWLSTQAADYVSTAPQDETFQLLGDCSFYKKPADYAKAVSYYEKSLELNPQQKRILQNAAIAYHTLKSYDQALEYYDKRIALGIDSASASIYKNAGYCALSRAGSKGEDDDLIGSDGSTGSADSAAAPVTGKNYYEIAVNYLTKYLEFVPTDAGALLRLGTAYLFNMGRCTDGVAIFERLLAVEPNNCLAKRSLGYAYFGDNACGKNYSKALNYFGDAYECLSKEGACKDPTLILWIAQCHHLRAAANSSDKVASKADYKAANDWYGKVLKCEPNNEVAKKAQEEIHFLY